MLGAGGGVLVSRPSRAPCGVITDPVIFNGRLGHRDRITDGDSVEEALTLTAVGWAHPTLVSIRLKRPLDRW